MCSWSNTQNIKMDKLDWELTSQEAESHYPTPAEDHSLGTEKGKTERDNQGQSYFDCGRCGKHEIRSCKSCISLLINTVFMLRVRKHFD